MISGKGKVINIGIYAHELEDNETFQDFYEEEILPVCYASIQLATTSSSKPDISSRSMSLTVWFYYSHFEYILVNI
jgi:hypothetical protein